jgi:dipeptidase D
MVGLQAHPVKATGSSSDAAERILTIFSEISAVPRCSKHEERISTWLERWAKERGFAVFTDARRNVLIRVAGSAGKENADPVVLQAHMDMVCQKADSSRHDFSTDPIRLVRDGDWVRADGTTLGADNGAGIAIALSVAEQTGSVHPPLELLFTADEEADMTGVAAITRDMLKGRKLINIDSEEDDAVTIGSAGGESIEIHLPLAVEPLTEGETAYVLRIDRLTGGHSGLEIGKNRANANVLAAQAMSGGTPFRLIRFSGGSAQNVITPASEMILALRPDNLASLKARIAVFEQEVRQRFPAETGFQITLSPAEERPKLAIPESDSLKAVQLVADLPQGVMTWSKAFSGLPETSSNVGVVEIRDGGLHVVAFARSSEPSQLQALTAAIRADVANRGGRADTRSRFPAWPPRQSQLYQSAMDSYRSLFDTDMKTEVIHAGLECGYIAALFPDMEIISIGPTLRDVHSTEERLYVPSLGKTELLIRSILERI